MAIIQNLNVNPYYDDYNETKGYERILFRPGYAVQARELTQLQTIIQKQVERFGNHIFKEGSMVLGGQTTYENIDVFYIKINDEDSSGNVVDVTNFVGKFIKKVGSSNVRAYVVAVADAESSDPKTLVVKYFTSEKFTNSDLIEDETSTYFATAISSSATGTSSIVSIADGVFFISGFFAKVNAQTIILDKYGVTPTYRVGLEVSDSIVDENSDTSLLDPALEASNYQAPGATRLKIELALAKRTSGSVDDSKFINLILLKNGLVEQKTVYPQYSILEDTLARRTFDESGDYTVRPFSVALSDDAVSNNGNGFANSFNIIVGPGKAYVKGYEFETISPTRIVVPRARDFETLLEYNLTLNYQNYVDVNKLKGVIDLKEFTSLNVHCVSAATLNTSSAATVNATKIGTIHLRALDYQYGANTTSTDGAVYRAYVFNANIGSLTGNATGGSANTITLPSTFATQNNAYLGVKLRISERSGNTAQSETKVIQSYNGITKVATFDSNWLYTTPDSNTKISLDFEFKDAESFLKTNTANLVTTSMDVSLDSKYSIQTDDYQGAFISEKNYDTLLFPFPNFAIKAGSLVTDSYFGRKVYTGTFNGSGVLTFSTGTGIRAAVTGAVSAADAIDNFFVVASNNIVNFVNTSNTVSVTTVTDSSVTVTAPSFANQAATIYMKVQFYDLENNGGTIRKSKIAKTANTIYIESASGDTITSNITAFYDKTNQPGLQLNITKDEIAALKDPTQIQSLYLADVYNVTKVLDFGSYAITTANVANTSDITSSYNFYSNQTDSIYDHSYIRLKQGYDAPTGNVVIFADYFKHTGGATGSEGGYFSVDSYPDYDTIPTYTSPNSGRIYYLRDLIDFRPKRKDGSSGTSGITPVFNESFIGISGTNFDTDFSYYLPRIDKLVLSKDKRFEIITGISSLTPKPPADKSDAMTLYMLILPAYVIDPTAVTARYVENRRYTMRDIGEIDQRVQNLEFLSTLNFLEKTALDETFVDDATGLPRVKTGIVVDPFSSFQISDVSNEDYEAAIDVQKKEVRPSFTHSVHTFELKDTTNCQANTSNMVTLEFTNAVFISQPMASSVISINPLGVPSSAISGSGSADLSDGDFYPDTDQPPQVVSNQKALNDIWAACAEYYAAYKKRKQIPELYNQLRALIKKVEKETGIATNKKWKKGYRCYRGEWKWWERRRKRRKNKFSTVTEEKFIDDLNLLSESKISELTDLVAATNTYDKNNLNSNNN